MFIAIIAICFLILIAIIVSMSIVIMAITTAVFTVIIAMSIIISIDIGTNISGPSWGSGIANASAGMPHWTFPFGQLGASGCTKSKG